MSNPSVVDQERINVALARAMLELWHASASMLSLNVDMSAAVASQLEDEDERKALVAEVMKSRDGLNLALEKIKIAVRLITPDSTEESEDADH